MNVVLINKVSYIFKDSREAIVKDGSLVVAIAGGTTPQLIFIDPKSLEHFALDLEAGGSLNDFAVDHVNSVVYVTCNDGKLYKVDLLHLQNPEDEDDDNLDLEGDDGDEIDHHLSDEEGAAL